MIGVKIDLEERCEICGRRMVAWNYVGSIDEYHENKVAVKKAKWCRCGHGESSCTYVESPAKEGGKKHADMQG